MSAPVLGTRTLARELRAGDLRVLVAALVVAVAAMTAVGFFTDRVERSVTQRASEVLAADLVLRSNRPIAGDHLRTAGRLGLETAEVQSFPSVVLTDDGSALADIEAVGPGYPLRGRVELAGSLLGEAAPATGTPPPGEAWADLRLLARLGAEPPVRIRLGRSELTITRVLAHRPDRSFSFVDLAPTLMISLDAVPATGLIQPGSRVSYRQLYAGEPGEVEALRDALAPRLGVSERLRGLEDAGPEIRGAVERARRFLGLAALVGSLLAATAVALTARRYALRQSDTVALMKCVGVSQGYVLGLYLTQLALLATAGGLAGAGAGFLAQFGLAAVLADLSGGPLPPAGAAPVLAGLALSFVILSGFALPAVIRLKDVPPLRVLRHEASPPAPSALLVYGAAALALGAILWWQARDPGLAGWMLAGMAGTALVLAAGAGGLVWLATRVRGSAGVAWRYAIAGIARRAGGSVLQVTAFGLGLTVLLLLTLVRGDLLAGWRASLPADAPNRFLINIQPAELPGVEAFLADEIGPATLAPMVRARLTAVNGTPVEQLEVPDAGGRRFLNREANLSWATRLQPDNHIVAGRWWTDPPVPGEVSVEQGFAAELGLAPGDTLRFDVAGESFEARITGLRSVQWDSFRPNFFMVFSPGTLENFPRTHIGAVHVPEGREARMLELVRRYPSVTIIDIDTALEQVRRVMDQASAAVEYVFLFVMAAGVVVLLALVETGRDERRFESALLRALGARRGQLTLAAVIEFALLGLLAGVLAAAGAMTVGVLMAERVFELTYRPDPLLWLAGPAAGMAVTVVTGLFATRKVGRQPPMAVLGRY